MDTANTNPSPLPDNISYELVHRLNIEKKIEDCGCIVDRRHSLKDAELWQLYPETYPAEFGNKSVYLLKTYDSHRGIRYIAIVLRCLDDVHVFPDGV